MSEKHSINLKIGGEKPMSTPEQQNTLEVKKVTHEEFPKLARQIRGLGRNALDTHEGTGFSEREEDVQDLDRKYLEAAKHGDLYVGVKNDVVIAFVALKKTGDGAGKKAIIEQIRYAAGMHRPDRIVGDILMHIKSDLEHKGIYHTEIETEGGHHNLDNVEGAAWFQKMFEITDSKAANAHDLDAHV